MRLNSTLKGFNYHKDGESEDNCKNYVKAKPLHWQLALTTSKAITKALAYLAFSNLWKRKLNDGTTIHKYLLCLLYQTEKHLISSTDMELAMQKFLEEIVMSGICSSVNEN